MWRTADPSTRLTDADNAVPPQGTTFTEAQESVNFVVFIPEWLPDDCRITNVTLRPELPPGRPDGVTAEDLGQTPWSEGNPCSVRSVIEGEGRRARLKQFLYDWAPPSASIAPLWGTPEPTPFCCGDTIGWLGTDYRDQRGACVQRQRTQLELSVIEGEFEDGELTRFLDGLTPAAPRSARLLHQVPFHQLSYWVRFQCRPPGVPHGLWEHTAARRYERSLPISPTALRREPTVPALVPATSEYVLDSAVEFLDHEALECVHRRVENGSDHLWTTAAVEGSPLSPTIPPDPSDQRAETREALDLRGTTVHHAGLTEEHGAWEAFWTEDGVNYAAWAGASRHLTSDGFRTIVDALDTL